MGFFACIRKFDYLQFLSLYGIQAPVMIAVYSCSTAFTWLFSLCILGDPWHWPSFLCVLGAITGVFTTAVPYIGVGVEPARRLAVEATGRDLSASTGVILTTIPAVVFGLYQVLFKRSTAKKRSI